MIIQNPKNDPKIAKMKLICLLKFSIRIELHTSFASFKFRAYKRIARSTPCDE